MTSPCFRSTPDGNPIPCGPPSTTLEQVRNWNNRARKILIMSVGQSNNGLTDEGMDTDPVTGGSIIDDGPGGVDAPDPRIREISKGIGTDQAPGTAPRYWVGPRFTTHVFQHPAQDDQGVRDGQDFSAQPNGICMRLPGAKALLNKYPNIEEITLYCGAQGNTALRREWNTADPSDPAQGAALEGRGVQQAVAYGTRFMNDHPDYEIMFWCSLGETDGRRGMRYDDLENWDASQEPLYSPAEVKQRYLDDLTKLITELRTRIPRAERALWVQADIPRDYPQKFANPNQPDGTLRQNWLNAVIEAQQEVHNHIPLTVPVTIFDLTTFDETHLDAPSVRTFGARMAAAASF